MQENGIPFDGTYFIVEVGHAHLVGIAENFMRQGITARVI